MCALPKEVLGGVKVFEFSFEENLLCVVQECVPLAVGAINLWRQTGGLVRCLSAPPGQKQRRYRGAGSTFGLFLEGRWKQREETSSSTLTPACPYGRLSRLFLLPSEIRGLIMINQHVSPRGAHRTRLIQSYRFFLFLLLYNKHHLEANLTREHPLIHPSSSRNVSCKDPPPPMVHLGYLGFQVFERLTTTTIQRPSKWFHIDQGEVVVFVWELLTTSLTCGVPQGSILGPLLPVPFALGSILRKRNISSHFYADDAQICVAKLIGCGPTFSP